MSTPGTEQAASTAPGAVAGLPSQEVQPGVDPTQDTAGQSGFSPFATVGMVVQQPAPVAPQQGGDWALPVVWMLVGIFIIASLLRKLVL